MPYFNYPGIKIILHTFIIKCLISTIRCFQHHHQTEVILTTKCLFSTFSEKQIQKGDSSTLQYLCFALFGVFISCPSLKDHRTLHNLNFALFGVLLSHSPHRDRSTLKSLYPKQSGNTCMPELCLTS